MRTVQLFIGLAFAGAVIFLRPTQALSAPQNYCRTLPVRSDALDWPSKHAWDLFVWLNHPAQNKKTGRGLPDCTLPFGMPGTTSVWETWRNAGTEVYLSDGSEPPTWDDTSLPDEKPAQVPPPPKTGSKGEFRPFFSPTDGIFHDQGGFGETRLNRATYEFIRQQCLFSREGQQRYAKAVADGKKSSIQFPSDAIEVKAAWLDFEREKVPATKQSTYYVAEYQGKKFGLVALHVLTKDVSNWFWATFHHKDSPPNEFETADNYGQPQAVHGNVWENYRLGGTQIDFTLPEGSPTVLSDYYVEFNFQRSSCITCHATASISVQTPMPAAQAKAVCSISPTAAGLDPAQCKDLIGKDAFRPNSDKLVMERGIPDPHWFEVDGKPFYLQTDFVYSIPFRGKKEQVAPPSRCIW